MSTNCILLTVEIELPGDIPEELQDEVADFITDELNIERLQAILKHWVHRAVGIHCHLAIDVE